jgi:hypothetical protein
MTTKSTAPPQSLKPIQAKPENSTDGTRGEPLARRALARRIELQQLLEKTPAAEIRLRDDINAALSAVAGMLTGDTAHLSDTTGAELNRWLESAKHLGEIAAAPGVAPAPAPTPRPVH